MSKKTGKKIFKIAFEIAAGAILVCLLAVFIMTKITNKPLFIGGKTTMWVMTQSMYPTIAPKTYILVEKATVDDVEVGDIVVFESTDPRIEGQYNTHRIIQKDGDKLVTKGDNNPGDDGQYSAQADKIVGKYVKNLTVMTFLGRLMMSTAGFVVIIILFILTTVLCVLPDFKSAIKEKEKEDEEKKKAEMERRVKEEVEKLQKQGADVNDLQRELDSREEKSE